MKSLYNDPNKIEKYRTEWHRPHEIRDFEEHDDLKLCIFNNPQISSFTQGKLSDCWLISSFIALIDHPEYLRNIFLISDYFEQDYVLTENGK